MWDENPKWQIASFKTTVFIAGAGTVLLSIICFLSGEISPMRNWILGVSLFVGSWLVIVGIVYLVVRLLGLNKSNQNSQK